MAPILGKQLSLLDSDVAFLGKALDGEDVTVIDARTRCSVKADPNTDHFVAWQVPRWDRPSFLWPLALLDLHRAPTRG
jgi:hypothetical protein